MLFLSGNAGISNELSELRQNLDQSLFTVATSPGAKLDPALLERESSRLSQSIDKYAPDYASRLTPSRLLTSTTTTKQSMRGASFVDNLLKVGGMLHQSTPLPSSGQQQQQRVYGGNDCAKRTLSFDTDA